MEDGQPVDDLSCKNGDFPSETVKLPEGTVLGRHDFRIGSTGILPTTRAYHSSSTFSKFSNGIPAVNQVYVVYVSNIMSSR